MNDRHKMTLWKYYRGWCELRCKCNSFVSLIILMIVLYSFPESELPPRIVRSFMGTTEEALMYLRAGFYLSLTGFLCKVS